MNKDDIKKHLCLLGQELQAKGITGEILLADGVIVLLDVANPEESDDIPAYFGGRGATIRETATNIASDKGLPESWLQDGLKELFSNQPSAEKWLGYPGLRIYLSPTAYVLAMKVAAAIFPQDIEDIKTLAEKLHISSAQEMLTHVKKYISEELLTPEMRQRVEECFSSGASSAEAYG